MNSFKDHFSGHAANYANYRPVYPAALADYLAEVAPRRGLAWDCGCGSGQLSALLAERYERVIATDASAEQLAHAELRPNLEYRRASAEACGIENGSVDLAVSAQAAHWFDLPGYYAEVRRVARPGAVVAMVTYGLSAIEPRIDAVVNHFYSEVTGAYWTPERRHVENGYRSLPFPFQEIDAPNMDMLAEWSFAEFLGYVETWSGVRALAKAEGRERIDAFARELSLAWGAAGTMRHVRWPISRRVGSVRAS